MERLKIVLVIAAIVATAHTSLAQQRPVGSAEQPLASSAQHRYVVIGDVRNFNYYLLSERTTVRQAVLAAGVLSDSLNVSVIRASQESPVWTQLIESTSADSDELVMNGDLLVVQSLLPLTEAVQRNAALKTDAGVIIVALADETIAVGDVLLQTNNPPSAGQRLKISSRFRGNASIASASVSDLVVHGDVVTISRGKRASLKGFGSLAPAFSEWQNSGAATPHAVAVPRAGQLQNNAPSMLPDEQSFGVQMEIPESFSETAQGPFQSVTSASPAETTAAAAESDIDQPMALQPVSQAVHIAETGAAVEAPLPPVEQSRLADPVSTAAASGTMSPWNLVFIGGLLIAGTLILAGSLRADEETATHTETETGTEKETHTETGEHRRQQQSASVVVTAFENTGIHGHAESSIVPATSSSRPQGHFSLTPGNSVGIVTPAAEVAIGEQARNNVTPPSLVSPNEWFSRDWLNSPSKSGTPQTEIHEPAEVVVIQLTSSEAVQSEPGQAATAPERFQESECEAEQQIAVSRFDSSALCDAVDETVPQDVAAGSAELTAAETLQNVRAAVSDEAAAESPVTGFQDLEDLLQNRLPIDLCETRLPLRIALFGRPAGPRRLRIDAAHSTFPAPHMNRSAERKRQETVTVSEASSEAQDQTTDAFGSLDRALHHLQERTDS